MIRLCRHYVEFPIEMFRTTSIASGFIDHVARRKTEVVIALDIYSESDILCSEYES
jgi:hypothetical protein